MPRSALSDFPGLKFSTKISTGLVEISDGFRDVNLTGEAAKRPVSMRMKAIVSCIVVAYSVRDHPVESHRNRSFRQRFIPSPVF